MTRAADVLRLDAAIEGVTGIALIAAPALVARVLFGTGLEGTGVIFARVAGMGLVGLALACWLGAGGEPLRAGVVAMLAYNALTFVYLALVGLDGTAGVLLWPAVVVHAAMAVFFVVVLRQLPGNPSP